MTIPGKRIKRTRPMQSERFVVDVEKVVPLDDPSEPCYESKTVELLKDVKLHADRGDRASLKQHGRVCEVLQAA